MQYEPGQTVVHPHHGPCTVTGQLTRTIKGVDVTYLQLHVIRTGMTIAVPLDKCDEVGVRPVADRETVERLIEVLQAPSDPEEDHWSRRIKANHDKLMLGDLMVTAAVARNLARRGMDGHLSNAEKEMLRQAREPVLGELAEALRLSEDEAEELFLAAVRGEDVTDRLTEHARAS
jgi:CarD family transcriptional regulator